MKRFAKDLRKYMYYAMYSAKIDLKAEVANSYLNWIWWVLEPFLNMLVYTFVFKNVFGKGDPAYPVFIFSGIITWNFFNRSVNYAVKLVRSNKGIVTKVYVPKYILLLGNMFLNLFKTFTGFIILIPMLFIYNVSIKIEMLYLFPTFLLLFIITFGCGTILLHFGVFIDDLTYAVSILLHMLMYLSGVFYNIDTGLPQPYGDLMGKFNPVALIIKLVHDSLLYGIKPNLARAGGWFVIAIVLCIVGVHTIYKYENSYVKVI